MTEIGAILFHDVGTRRHIDAQSGREWSLVVTRELRVAEDFAKALALGADVIVVSSSAMQAFSCITAQICNSNNCPIGIATQKTELCEQFEFQVRAERLAHFFGASVELTQILARA